MVTNKKAETRNCGSSLKTNDYFADNQKTFSKRNYSQYASGFQCIKCRSEYMKFATNGYCQRCQQLMEHLNRERLNISGPKTTGGGGSL